MFWMQHRRIIQRNGRESPNSHDVFDLQKTKEAEIEDL